MKQMNVHVDDTTPEFAYLNQEAIRRGITPTGLMRRIMRVVMTDKLVDGILDDADEIRARGTVQPTTLQLIRESAGRGYNRQHAQAQRTAVREAAASAHALNTNVRAPAPAPSHSREYQRDAYTPARDRNTHPVGKSGLRDLLADAVKNT